MLNRRTVLLTTVSAISLFSGCTSSESPVSTSESTKRPPSLSYSASVIAPRTSDSPLTIELGVINEGPSTIYLKQEESTPLTRIPAFEGQQANLGVFPVESETLPEPTEQQECWRIDSEDRETSSAPQLEANSVEIEPDNKYTVQHYIYQIGNGSVCFPSGQYRTTVNLIADNRGEKITPNLTYALDISSSGVKIEVNES